MKHSPKIAVTLGDPAGIGPEVALKALRDWQIKKNSPVVLLGRADFYASLARSLRLPLKFIQVDSVDEKVPAGVTACFCKETYPAVYRHGVSQNAWTELAVKSIESGVRLAMTGKVEALVTAPINKAGLRQAGFQIPGHTEYLAELSRTRDFEMMLVGGPLRVVLVTRHTPIRRVPSQLTKSRVEKTILMTDRELRQSFRISKPRIAVCGLNPHAGEKGTIGREDIEIIAPAVHSAKRKTRSSISGPHSPDVVFYEASRGRYDAVVCMYHDQGLIPLKMISRGFGVNITLGLPFVRTSPDHGTAYDLAGHFKADSGSMFQALTLAAQIANNRRQHA